VPTSELYLKSAPPRFSRNSCFARAIVAVSRRSSDALNASVFAATIMPLKPMDIPVQAVACQLCPGTPGTYVAVVTWAVGTFQLMSPMSVEADPTRPTLMGSTSLCTPMGVLESTSVARIFSANASSSGV